MKKRLFIALILLLPLLFLDFGIKQVDGVIYEEESLYHYIQVVEDGGMISLKLNEGVSVHSKYNPSGVFVDGVWDWFNLFPIMHGNAEEVLLIGSAAGTMIRQYNYFFPSIWIDAVELDEKITAVGRKYFNLNTGNFVVYNTDGRTYIWKTGKRYDIIIIDAYRQPYIPFHLTTKEFFSMVKDKLKDRGIMAINVGALSRDSDILVIITNTVSSVFPNTYTFHVPGTLNYLVFASEDPISFAGMGSDIGELWELGPFISALQKNAEKNVFDSSITVLSDDRAPVEVLTDRMILSYAVKT